ncbi:hypothetical protein TNCV_3848491 [Trichonephila clavipes]|uniref:Uncharacterized protein n=1 Tax=Trichonephila clavipes TaxID=2585209 RepID=A0A8X6RCW0_TRICX|nr:hypothetical protein TNCV_3848491 [Trichonephila clavipes]
MHPVHWVQHTPLPIRYPSEPPPKRNFVRGAFEMEGMCHSPKRRGGTSQRQLDFNRRRSDVTSSFARNYWNSVFTVSIRFGKKINSSIQTHGLKSD